MPAGYTGPSRSRPVYSAAPMRAWAKMLIGSTAVLALAAAGAAAAEWIKVHRRPAWYGVDRTTPEQRRVAARRAEDTLVRLQAWSAERPAADAVPATHPVSFTDGQLNAFYDKWVNLGDRRATVDAYVHDPRLVAGDGQIILAGEVQQIGLVVSLFVRPNVAADGRLRLALDKVVAGVVPVPDAFFASQRAALERTLVANLPADQAAARLGPDGLANGSAATAAMDQLLLAMLRGQPAEPVVFVPVGGGSTALLPVRITAVTAHDHTLAMTAAAMTPDERRDLLARIKTPDGGDATSK